MRLEGLTADGYNLGELPGEKISNYPVQPGTLGEFVGRFVCYEDQSEADEVGYATILPPFETADHFFRLIGLGLDREIAAGLAGIDAERAPKTFEKLLNALVESELHLYVRAIKTPNAALEP